MSSIGQGSISIDDSTRIGQNAQDTANEVAGNVNDINSDNKLTPSEKLKLKQEYDKDLKLYAIDVSQLQSAGISTTELNSALNNLTNFVTPLFKEMNRTSTVDRDALDSVFTAFATADKNASQAFANMVQQVADDAKNAGSDAKKAGEKAQELGQEAKAAANQAKVDANQAKSDALTAQQKAQSSIDQLNDHLPDIDKALSTTNLVKQDVTKLSDTTEQYRNEYTTGIQNVVKKVDNLEISNRNLALGTSNQVVQANSWNMQVADIKYDKSLGKALCASVMINNADHASDLKQGSANIVLQTLDKSGNVLATAKGNNVSYNANGLSWCSISIDDNTANVKAVIFTNNMGQNAFYSCLKIERGTKATPYSPAPEDQVSQSQITQLSGEIEQKVDNGDFSTYKTQTDKLIGSKVDNGDFSTYKTQTAELIESRVDNGTYQSDKTQTADLISQTVKKNDVVNQINISNEGILIDGKKVHITGNTSIDNAVIKNAMIANAAINTAQIADAAINNAKIANASIDDAKINSLNGNKLVENSITANKINVDDLIANGINTKTLTSVNLNTSTLTTPKLNLGLNGTFTEDFDYTQATSMFLPKKNKGTLTFDHGSLQSKGDMQTYVDGKWGGMNDDYKFQAGIDNSQWTEVAPGYIKLDLFKQNDADVGQRTYIDPTGYYYTSRNGIASYLGNVLQVPQVQTSSVLAEYIGPRDGKSLLQIGSNGSHYGLQVGPYAGNEAVLSDFIYNSTTSGAPNVNITANGHLVRSTSASKYKYNIKNPDIETTLGDRLLNVHLATWNDKHAVDMYAEQLSTGEEREKTSIDKYYGLIAEQLRDAGLDMFINYGKNHEIEGIQYDRAWVPLLSVIRRLNNKVNEYELRISKLEGKINE
ncbi:hypothetical protein I6H67_04085 [Pediococcus pentosaceus]|uniref:hypothetical protein n=1 Tax=Pediococcus pentosaceus TaxID=1255 RepID=UPI0018E1D1AC|nr:hypothetical protein [Pediococcus pentosaceus]MBF7104625.1 hypothetical protein [Pediococcus pentosaceus]QQC62037.1 hypothetical protein I6H67_04085 [Pediococcus pentosaceus]